MGKFRWYLRLSSLVGLGFLILSYQNCGNPERFSQAQTDSQSSSGAPENCSTVLQQTTENLKILFMFDNSNSTNSTDPNKYYRVTVLQNFLAQYGSKTNFQYSFSWFAPHANVWDVSKNAFDPNAEVSFSGQPFGQSSDLNKALNAFTPLGTQGGTVYTNAFDAVKNIVDLDAQISGGALNYILIFASDGQPTDLGNSGSSQLSGIQGLVSMVLSDVQSHGSNMSISAVYFGKDSDKTSVANLTAMASQGGGQFVDTNQVTDLQISDLISVPGQVCTPGQ